MDRFLVVHELTAEFEGGWSDHPADPGGKTMYGITEAVYHAWLKKQGLPARQVRLITREDALKIYRAEYWLKAGCDNLAPGVDRMVYDAAVNSGVKRSRTWLMQAIGGSDAETVQKLATIRLDFLVKLRTWKTFGKGWTRRVNAMRERALQEVRAPDAPKPKPRPEPVVPPGLDKPLPNSTTVWSAIGGFVMTLLASLGQFLAGLHPAVQGVVVILLFVSVIGGGLFAWRIISERARYARQAREMKGQG